ncbi:unnamed protein product, partial [Brassica oleracea]
NTGERRAESSGFKQVTAIPGSFTQKPSKEEVTTGSFTSLMKKDLYRSEGISISQHLLNGIPTTITAEINDKLTQEVTDKEIEDAAHAINPDKSPGPDGMNAGFF